MKDKGFFRRVANTIVAANNKIPDGAAPAGYSWSPLDLGANLFGWWNAGLGVSTSGSNVTTWTDQSANGYVATTVTAGGSITLNATDANINNKPSITVTGGAYMTLTRDMSDDFNGQPECSVNFVLRRRANATLHALLDIGMDNSNSRIYGEIRADNKFLGGGRSNGSDSFLQDVSTSTILSTDGYVIVSFEMDLTNDYTQTYKNNAAEGNDSATNYNANVFGTNTGIYHTFFAWFDGSGAKGNFDVADIIITNSRLSNSQRDGLAYYLNSNYGMSVPYIIEDPSSPTVFFANPSSLDSLGLWLDFSDASSLTVDGSSNITALTDKSPYGHTVEIVNTPKRTKQYNGKYCMSLQNTDVASTNSYLKFGNQLTNMIYNKAGISLFIIHNPTIDKQAVYPALTDYQTYQILFDTWNIVDQTRVRMYMLNNGAPYFFTRDSQLNGATRKVAVPTKSPDELRLWDGIADVPGQTLLWYENNAVFANGYSTNNMSYTKSVFEDIYSDTGIDTIGAEHYDEALFPDYPYGGAAYIGDICEVILYNRELTALEAEYVRDYLSTKWGLTIKQ